MANTDEWGVDCADASSEYVPERRPAHLQIYVAQHCESCNFAYDVAERIRNRYPSVIIDIVDIGVTPEKQPEMVFATPTYVLEGRIWSLGNPSEQMIADAFSSDQPA